MVNHKSDKYKPLKLSEADNKLIDELAGTKTVKEIAKIVKAKFSKKDLTDLIAAYLFFNAKGREEEAINFFVKEHFSPLIKIGFAGFIDLLPDLLGDPHFIKIMLSLFGERFSLKKLFK